MPKRSSILNGKSREEIMSLIQRAVRNGKNPAAVMLGRLGGLKGGRARADMLTQEQRSEISKRAAEARWSKELKRNS